MNFLDAYDITRSTTPNPNQPEQPSLNDEVNQVMGQLGRLWGGFRKQSQTAIETARKDFSSVVVQAQKEITKLTSVPDDSAQDSTTRTSASADSAASGSNDNADSVQKEKTAAASGGASGDAAEASSSSSSAPTSSSDQAQGQSNDAEAGNNTAATGPSASTSSRSSNSETDQPAASSSSSSSVPSSSNTFFSRLQSSIPLPLALPPSTSTVFTTLQDSLKSAASTTTSTFNNLDVNQMRTHLVGEFQRVQGMTLAQAEEYVHKSEALLKEAYKEAGEVLRDAVKVIPPEEQQQQPQGLGAGMVWDGTDIWMVPSAPYVDETATNNDSSASSKASSPSTKKETSQTAVATRAEALLKRLKHDPEILRHDPEAEVHEEYVKWRTAEVDTREGGILGGDEVWKGKIKSALEDDGADGEALQVLKDLLVPAELTEEAFWMRFFFRSHQIRAEEEKRKALIQSSTETDDDFSWEDDEDEPASAPVPTKRAEPSATPSAPLEPTTKPTLARPAGILSPSDTSANPSRRVSSEDSFDMVSTTSMSVIGPEDTTPTKAGVKEGARPPVAAAEDDDDDDDSDWE